MPQTYPADLALLTNQLADAYGRAWSQVVAEQQRIAQGLALNPRLWRQRDRLQEVRDRIELEMNNVDALAAHWTSREFPRHYMAGAEDAAARLASPFEWTQTHREAVVLLAKDTMDDLLEATTHVREDTKRFLREVIRPAVLTDQLAGKTAKQTARNVTRYLQARGIHAVKYANGARVGLATYAEMAIRTKTAVAYNVGTFNQGAEFGVKFYEVFDGGSCGWTSHNDVDLANGSIRSAEEAATFTIAHPNCARSFGPRPDLATKTEAKKAEPTAGGQAKDRPEAAQFPLEAAARTGPARQAAVARRTQAGLQGRVRTPQRVLERRAAMLQRVRLPRGPRGPGRQDFDAPAPPPPKWRQDFDAARAQLDPDTIPTWSRMHAGEVDVKDVMRLDGSPALGMLEREKALNAAGTALDREVTKRATATVKRQGLADPAKLQKAADDARDALNVAQEAHYNLDRLIRNELIEADPNYLDLPMADRRARIIADPRYRASDAAVDRLQAEALRLGRVLVDAEQAYALAYRDAALEVLGEIRPMGGIGGVGFGPSNTNTTAKVINLDGTAALVNTPAEIKQVTDALESASDFFPRDWLVRSNERGKLRPGLDRRGFQRELRDGDSDLVLSPGERGYRRPDDPGMLNVATHEVGHRMEFVDERIRAMEWTFHSRRTSVMDRQYGYLRNQQKAVDLGGSMAGEMTMPDKFLSKYMGKTYGNSPASYYELLSMGMEGIFTGSNRVPWKDADFRRFILGMLGSL